MKKNTFVMAIGMFMAIGTMQLYAQPPAGYTLVRADEFNGPSLDQSLWIPYYLESRTTQERAAARYSFRDGALVLRIDQDQPTYYPNNPMKVSSIQTGQRSYLHKDEHNHNIPTVMNYTPQYGYFEIRAKTVNQAGYHVAFWTVGRRDESWQEAEFDIIEQYGGDGRYRFNLIGWDDPNISDNTNDQALNITSSSEFHTYGLEWTPTNLKFYVDGNVVRTVNQSPNYGMVFFLSIYENSGWTGTANTSPSLYPREFIIDYFRAYSPSNSGGNSGYSTITNRNSGNCLRAEGGDIVEAACNTTHWSQQFELVDAGNGYYRLHNRNTDNCIRVTGGDVVDVACNESYWSQQFQLVDAGGGYYRLQNRDSGNCLRIVGGNVVEEACNSSYWSQQFTINPVGSGSTLASTNPARNSTFDLVQDDANIRIYPNPVSSVLSIELPSHLEEAEVEVKVLDLKGKLIRETRFTNKLELDVTELKPGLYTVQITNKEGTIIEKFIKVAN